VLLFFTLEILSAHIPSVGNLQLPVG